ncbi:hypothetical protein DFH06DRAFT_1342505 [Mycena polygramma]|nr:hypothetical protein DFH06DRAFT_1342505 [Mycena polygramma]
MTALTKPPDEPDDVAARLANLHLNASTATPAPRTPSPRPPPYDARTRHTFPTVRSRLLTSSPSAPPSSPSLYHVNSPSYSGDTPEWSIAGAATQGVPGATVSADRKKKKRKKPSPKVYVIFCGKECGLKYTWNETAPLVLGVSGSIYRGYATVPEGEAAYEYALVRSWTRVTDGTPAAIVTPIPALPQPLGTQHREVYNPLNGSEALDDSWFVVYCGVYPGVYRSHLECQLNTLGIKGAIHHVVNGKSCAMQKYREALERGDVRVLTPAYSSSVFQQ